MIDGRAAEANRFHQLIHGSPGLLFQKMVQDVLLTVSRASHIRRYSAHSKQLYLLTDKSGNSAAELSMGGE
jgi:hypothetical protein